MKNDKFLTPGLCIESQKPDNTGCNFSKVQGNPLILRIDISFSKSIRIIKVSPVLSDNSAIEPSEAPTTKGKASTGHSNPSVEAGKESVTVRKNVFYPQREELKRWNSYHVFGKVLQTQERIARISNRIARVFIDSPGTTSESPTFQPTQMIWSSSRQGFNVMSSFFAIRSHGQIRQLSRLMRLNPDRFVACPGSLEKKPFDSSLVLFRAAKSLTIRNLSCKTSRRVDGIKKRMWRKTIRPP